MAAAITETHPVSRKLLQLLRESQQATDVAVASAEPITPEALLKMLAELRWQAM